MAEGLQTPDGAPLDVPPAGAAGGSSAAEFSRAMAAPVADIPAPPDRPERPAEPAKPRRGRPPGSGTKKAEDKPAKGKPVKPALPVKSDYTEDAQKLVSTAWLVTAGIPQTQGYALVLHNSSDALVAALNDGAKHNATVRQFVSQGGEASWQLQLAAVAAQMGMQAWQIYKDPQLRQQAAEATKAQLAEFVGAAKQVDVPEEPKADGPGHIQQV